MSRIRKAAVVAVLMAAAALTTGTASAATPTWYDPYGPNYGNTGWDDQFGSTGSGCYMWTTYSQYMVTLHAYQQAGNSTDTCRFEVAHVGYNADGSVGYSNTQATQETSGPGSEIDGPSWYYGPWNGTGHMCVNISVWDAWVSPGSRPSDIEYC